MPVRWIVFFIILREVNLQKLEIFEVCQKLASSGVPFSFRNLDSNWILLYLTRDSEVMGYYAQSECDDAKHNYGQMAGRWYVNSLDYEYECVPSDINTAYRLFYDSYRYDQSGTLKITRDDGIVTAEVLRRVRFDISRQLRRRDPGFWADVAAGYYRTEDCYNYLDSVHVSLLCSCCQNPEYIDFFDHG